MLMPKERLKTLKNAGLVGIALAKAGARVTYADLPHITPLTAENIARNSLQSSDHEVRV